MEKRRKEMEEEEWESNKDPNPPKDPRCSVTQGDVWNIDSVI